VQWIGDTVEIIMADDSAYVAMAKITKDLQDGEVKCLNRRDLSDYDYVSVGKGGFVPINVKLTIINLLQNVRVNND
jgi:hypothetical protein